jgi:hypothetical protein
MRLTRTPVDGRLYVFEGVGTLRLTGWMSHAATAEARGLSWQISSRGRDAHAERAAGMRRPRSWPHAHPSAAKVRLRACRVQRSADGDGELLPR